MKKLAEEIKARLPGVLSTTYRTIDTKSKHFKAPVHIVEVEFNRPTPEPKHYRKMDGIAAGIKLRGTRGAHDPSFIATDGKVTITFPRPDDKDGRHLAVISYVAPTAKTTANLSPAARSKYSAFLARIMNHTY